MHCLKINNIPYNVPSSWNELSRKQLLNLVDMYNKQYSFTELSVKLLLIITGLRLVFVTGYTASGFGITSEVYQFRHGRHVFIVDTKDIILAAGKLQFLFRIIDENGQKHYMLYSKLSKNLMPDISFGIPFFKTTWYGPSDSITNIKFSEFIHTETAYEKLMETGNDEYLNRLVAILYRPSGKTKLNDPNFRGDIREPFNDFMIDRRSKRAMFIADNIKIAILLYYTGCRLALTKIFPDVFGGSGSTGTDTFKSYMNLVETLANYDITKKEDIRNAYLYDVLLTLNQSILRDREREKELKKMRRV